METKLSTLQRQIADSKKREENLKERAGNWKKRALEDRAMLRSLTVQYERVVREYKKTLEGFKNNITKMFFLHLYTKFRNWKEGRRGIKHG